VFFRCPFCFTLSGPAGKKLQRCWPAVKAGQRLVNAAYQRTISSHCDRSTRHARRMNLRAMTTNSHAMRMNSHATPSERVDYSVETHSLKEESTLDFHSAKLAESIAAHCVPRAYALEAVACSVPDCERPAAVASRSDGATPAEACFRRSDRQNRRDQCGLPASRWTWFRDRCLQGTSATHCDLPVSAMA